MLKPSVYLDQNALTALLKEASEKLVQILAETWEIFYSSATMNEIIKAGSNSNDQNNTLKYLQLLDGLKAKPLFEIIENDQLIGYKFVRSTAFQVHEHYKEQEHIQEISSNLLKIGMINYVTGEGLENYKNQHSKCIGGLIKFMRQNIEQLKSIEQDPSTNTEERFWVQKAIPIVEKEMTVMEVQLSEANKGMNSTLDNLKETVESEAINKLIRRELNINHDNLNKIFGKGAFESIVSYVLGQHSNSDEILKPFLEEIKNPEISIHTRIGFMYEFLNLIGYQEDKNLSKEKRYMASLEDRNHAMAACCCDILITNDKRLASKLKVAYDYFELDTRICSIENISELNLTLLFSQNN